MASDSDDEDTDGEVDDKELSNELKELQMDREAHMYAFFAIPASLFLIRVLGKTGRSLNTRSTTRSSRRNSRDTSTRSE